MKTLDPDWFLRPVIEFEGKSYTFLAWLQRIDKAFDSYRLYPWKNDLHSAALFMRELMDSLEGLKGRFSKDITGFELNPPVIHYHPRFEDSHHLSEIRKIMDWSLVLLEPRISRARELFELLLAEIELEPLGIEPINRDEGYLFIETGTTELRIYRYSHKPKFFLSHQEPVSTNLHFVGEALYESGSGIMRIKRNLSTEKPGYLVKSKTKLPLEQTLLPLAEIRLQQYLSQ